MKLAPELRNRIYELTVYIPAANVPIQPIGKYKRRVYFRLLTSVSFNDTPTEFPTYDAIHVNKGPRLTCYKEGSKPTPVPGILMTSKQIRKEALPMFYNSNAFIFYDCAAAKVVEWLREIVCRQEQHKHLACVVWQGPFNKENCEAGCLLMALEKAGQLRRRTTKLMIYPKEHIECAIEESIDGMAEVDLAAMTGWELTEGLRLVFEDWWTRHKDDFGQQYVCMMCSAATSDAAPKTEN